MPRPFDLDLRSLAAFRIGLGLILLYDLLDRARNLAAHYTDAGVLPRDLLPPTASGAPPLSLHLLSGDAPWQVALFLLAAALAAALLLGWRTRLATIGSWVLLTSLQVRNPLICYEADILLALLLFWGAFLPLGACWSLDARGQDPPPPGAVVRSGGSVALVLQVAFVYIFATLLKNGETWWNGTAVAYALGLDLYCNTLGRAIRAQPWLTAALTWGTLVAEGLGGWLLLLPGAIARWTALALIGGLQVGLFLAMDLGIFQPVSLLALVPLLPSSVWTQEPSPPARVESRRPLNWFAGVCVALALVWNLASLHPDAARGPERTLPAAVRWPAGLLRLDQAWPMFAPDPATIDMWFLVAAWPRDGDARDLLSRRRIRWDKPSDVSASFGGDRWKEYYVFLSEEPYDSPLRDAASGYHLRNWTRAHPDRPLRRLAIVQMREETRLDMDRALPTPVTVAEWPKSVPDYHARVRDRAPD